MSTDNSFEHLVENTRNIHEIAHNRAKSAINQSLTARNWVLGYYIVEYEQNGNDRAKYGSKLLENLSSRLSIKGLDRSMLSLCRLFYLRYSQLSAVVVRRFPEIGDLKALVLRKHEIEKENCPAKICDSVNHKFETEPEMLISRLSFTHIREIMPIEDSFERFFYETECIKCGWSVRELRRQISTNLYLRAGISKKPELLLPQSEPALTLKEPFTFEFLGLEAKDAVAESDLERALILHLQDFLLELGKGFCFEARQKRIIIDDRYYFPDLVFYNRLLHCNVIIELKNDEFKHEYLGQLNAYVAYYKENEMVPGDNAPVGILLCTKKGTKMVEYALSGMDNQLFVSTYMLQLPNKTQLEAFLQKQMQEIGLHGE
ncbi:MAG: DUF1016 family protein [Schwartzia sp.]|nr:DUF1016 family protein [Schwartzia sp. (in: firmicutes)]